MAIGAMTIDDVVRQDGGIKMFKVHFAGDGAYPTNGTLALAVTDALKLAIKTAAAAAADANIRAVEQVDIFDWNGGDCGQYEAYWTAIGLKVLDGGSGTRAEVGAGVSLAGTTFYGTFVCK